MSAFTHQFASEVEAFSVVHVSCDQCFLLGTKVAPSSQRVVGFGMRYDGPGQVEICACALKLPNVSRESSLI